MNAKSVEQVDLEGKVDPKLVEQAEKKVGEAALTAKVEAAQEKAKAPQTWRQSWNRKSYKREASVVLGVFWMILTTKLFFGTSVELINALNMTYSTVTTLIGAVLLSAFGLDAYVKQVKTKDPAEG